MSARDSTPQGAQDQLRAMLHQRRERLVNRLSSGDLPAERNDEIAEEVDYLDSALARLEDPGTPCCMRCGEPICLTRRTLAPDSELCTGCALVADQMPRGGREGPTSTWDAEFLPEMG
ncbi:MAG TPA: hypothetical protein VLG41_07215 [Hydrogenophaga sp.]|uniref:hypothetical protein n=1 Tax=Hydrogenophaga sp. TaxID=1904254 RepID=UPI002C81EF3B|nr:hypothetical protein [Hydrogenophaga sp.]HSX92692.1 hypothetical protein [Hydrogenophaga sp.]